MWVRMEEGLVSPHTPKEVDPELETIAKVRAGSVGSNKAESLRYPASGLVCLWAGYHTSQYSHIYTCPFVLTAG